MPDREERAAQPSTQPSSSGRTATPSPARRPRCTSASSVASSSAEGGGMFRTPVSLYIKRTHIQTRLQEGSEGLQLVVHAEHPCAGVITCTLSVLLALRKAVCLLATMPTRFTASSGFSPSVYTGPSYVSTPMKTRLDKLLVDRGHAALPRARPGPHPRRPRARRRAAHRQARHTHRPRLPSSACSATTSSTSAAAASSSNAPSTTGASISPASPVPTSAPPPEASPTACSSAAPPPSSPSTPATARSRRSSAPTPASPCWSAPTPACSSPRTRSPRTAIRFFAMDVSFISATLVLPAVLAALAAPEQTWQGEPSSSDQAAVRSRPRERRQGRHRPRPRRPPARHRPRHLRRPGTRRHRPRPHRLPHPRHGRQPRISPPRHLREGLTPICTDAPIRTNRSQNSKLRTGK